MLTQKVFRHSICKGSLKSLFLSAAKQVLLSSAPRTDYDGNGLMHNCFFLMVVHCLKNASSAIGMPVSFVGNIATVYDFVNYLIL